MRNTVAVLPVAVAAVQSASGPISSVTPTATSQVRVMAPHSTVTTTIPRAAHQVQQRLVSFCHLIETYKINLFIQIEST